MSSTDKVLYDKGMRAGDKAGNKAVKKAGVTGDKKLMGIRFKASDKAHKESIHGKFVDERRKH